MKRHVNRLLCLAVLAGVAASATTVQAGSVSAGKQKAATCTGCHGPQGKSVNPLWPHLAGQQEAYLAKQLRDYREGKRSDPVMAPMAAALSDEDIADLAAYFASLK